MQPCAPPRGSRAQTSAFRLFGGAKTGCCENSAPVPSDPHTRAVDTTIQVLWMWTDSARGSLAPEVTRQSNRPGLAFSRTPLCLLARAVLSPSLPVDVVVLGGRGSGTLPWAESLGAQQRACLLACCYPGAQGCVVLSLVCPLPSPSQ